MLPNLPTKLFTTRPRFIEFGACDITLYSKRDFEESQLGFRTDYITKEPILEWIGDNYWLIGDDSTCGDPFIIDTNNKNFPVYTIFHDDWNIKIKVADSFDSFVDILKLIKSYDLKDSSSIDRLITKIKALYPKPIAEHWTDFINLIMNFMQNKKLSTNSA